MENYKNITLEKLSSWGLAGKVKREIFIDSCIKNILEPEEQEFYNLKNNWIQKMQISNEYELNNWLEINCITEKLFNEYLIREWKWHKWCLLEFNEKIDNYYLNIKNQYDKFTFFIIRLSSQSLADEIYLRIKEKEASFSEIAEKYSEGPEKNTRGIIGPITLNNLHPKLADFLLNSNQAELNKIINIENFFFITQLISRDIQILDEKFRLKLSLELGDKLIVKSFKN